MTEKPLPLEIPAGVVMTQSVLGAAGRYVDCSWVRFWRGKPQKVGGYVLLNQNGQTIGVPRGSTAWSDSATRQLVGIGTNLKLYYMSDTDYLLTDITPWRVSATLANPITVSAGSDLVNIAYPAHGADIGDYLDISGATLVDNFNPNGSFQIVGLVDPNNVTIQAPQQATVNLTGGGAAVLVGIEISTGPADPQAGFGWGAGTWGTGTWGTPRETSAISFSPRIWSMGNFGRVLIACPNNGALYAFDPSLFPIQRAAKIANAPSACTGVVVTSDNIVIAFGSSYDPNTTVDGGPAKQNLLQWWACAQGDYTNWNVLAFAGPNGSPSVAGVLREGTRIVGALDAGNHVTLMWTDTALHMFQYTGSQFVFNVRPVATECGLIGPEAAVLVDNEAYWVSPHGFKMYNGGVQNIPNYQDISEWVISQLRPFYTVKTIAWYNQRFNEVWFAFVPNGASEPTHYVAVNRDDWSWTKGAFPEPMSAATRFSGYDARPLVIGSVGNVYQFDNGLDANGAPAPWFLKTGGLELSNGEANLEVSGLALDMQRQIGTIALQVTTYDRTPATPEIFDQDTVSFGPAEKVADLRVSGRIAQLRFSGGGALGDDFRFGVSKLLFGAGGARR